MTIDINAIRMQVERYTGFAGDSQSSLAHRLAAQVPALLNEREVLRAQVADLADKLHKADAEIASHTKAATAWANENDSLLMQLYAQKPVVEAVEAWAEARETDPNDIPADEALKAEDDLFATVEQYRVWQLALDAAHAEAEVA